jgi:hypothetical protein
VATICCANFLAHYYAGTVSLSSARRSSCRCTSLQRNAGEQHEMKALLKTQPGAEAPDRCLLVRRQGEWWQEVAPGRSTEEVSAGPADQRCGARSRAEVRIVV